MPGPSCLRTPEWEAGRWVAGSEPEATRLSFPVNLSPWRPEGRRPEVERLGESARGGGAPVQRGLRGRLSPPRQRPCARLKPVPLLEALHLLEHFLTGGGGVWLRGFTSTSRGTVTTKVQMYDVCDGNDCPFWSVLGEPIREGGTEAGSQPLSRLALPAPPTGT